MKSSILYLHSPTVRPKDIVRLSGDPLIQDSLTKKYDNDGVCHNKWNGGKLHGNISRNGYGNAMIGRYGGCFEEGIWWVYDTGERCAVLERLAMVEG